MQGQHAGCGLVLLHDMRHRTNVPIIYFDPLSITEHLNDCPISRARLKEMRAMGKVVMEVEEERACKATWCKILT